MSFDFISRWLGRPSKGPIHGLSGRPPQPYPQAHLMAQPDFLPPTDIAEFVHFYRSRNSQKDSQVDQRGCRRVVDILKWDVKTKDGAVIQSSYLDAPMGDKLKISFEKAIAGFFPLVHQQIESLADQMHRILVFPLEYTLKAGQNLAETLGWHQDEDMRYLGFLGVHLDPRIRGAQLEVRRMDYVNLNEPVQTFPTVPGQLLAFHNVRAEHRVNGATVDNLDPETPALRNVITLGLPS